MNTKRREELPHVRRQGQRPRVPGCNGAGTAERSYPASEVSGGGWEELPASEVRGRSREELAAGRSIRGVVAMWVQEGLEEPSHIEGQEQRR